MTLESTFDAVFAAFYAATASGIASYLVGWAVSHTIRPGFARLALPLVFLGLVLAFALSIGIPLFALWQYQLGWLWPIRAISTVVSIGLSIICYWWGTHSFITRRVGV